MGQSTMQHLLQTYIQTNVRQSSFHAKNKHLLAVTAKDNILLYIG